ncbi:MAG TPA: pyridoxamine 5'-phosphate oxidase family protein [Candidatus Saccharimonadales bacterium]|nr:pyridoxamine 5'-phosphate oxidase family protein [Candidatus Saccharimonadales bacterium]
MKIDELINNYVKNQYMMQLATSSNGQPWCCTVYYVADNELNLYWLSLPTRRHSREIDDNNRVAVAIPVKFVLGEKVVGVQAEGSAEHVPSSEKSRDIAKLYAKKFNRGDQWVDDYCSGKTDHKLYKFTPEKFVIFDDINYPNQPRQEHIRKGKNSLID